MARRNSKAEGAIFLFVLAIGLPIYIASKVIESIGWFIPVIIIISTICLFIWRGKKKKKDRLIYLRKKYNDENIVQNIVGGYFWQGQTQEQLIDSIGHPIAVDNKALKTVVREVWKYNQTGKIDLICELLLKMVVLPVGIIRHKNYFKKKLFF